MENIFKNLGISVSNQRNSANDKEITVLIIHNTDGTPRWIWNADCKHPYLLKFYNIGSFKARVFAFVIQLVFKLKLQGVFFKKETFYVIENKESNFVIDQDWALFTGTVGPNNKAILYANNSFYKIATTSNAQVLINKEDSTLQRLSTEKVDFIMPISKKISNTVIQLTDISNNVKRGNNFTDIHFHILNQMSLIDKQLRQVKNWESFKQIQEEFNNIKDSRIPTNIVRKINLICSQIKDDEIIETTFSHGDFTQWNVFVNDKNLAVYDWELSNNDAPKGFDFFHYIIQKGILVDRKNWKAIYATLKEHYANKTNQLFDKKATQEFECYLKYYLLVCVMQYITIYAKQPKWHMQVDWLLQTWNEALNHFLKEEKKSRELVIMDLFDSLHNLPYATLKFNNGYPEQLSELSDIDMICAKKANDHVVQLLENHSLVAKLTVAKKSYMNTVQIITNEGDLLSIDLIWKLKVRNLTILDADKMVKNSVRNSFGVKTTSAIDTARYIALFYVLNGAKIPQKYLVYEQALINSKNRLDEILRDYFIDDQKSKKAIANFIKSKKQNKKLFFLKNTIFYFLDALRSVRQNKGFTITFSGVDGAGKSTIITNITHQIEKQLRRPVIVLRHRPSILPILSVWTKGKAKAHQDVISNLPRQGNNANVLSSFARFSYYYVDYLVGQFIIYCKYILRGYVVVYDRYYFDFINDSKRSNIQLPKWFSKIGYTFLLKPKFNFFLFADAETILSRKKELNKETIENLNKEYQLLFENLQSKNNHSTYKAIKNDEMETTLKNILTTIKTCEL